MDETELERVRDEVQDALSEMIAMQLTIKKHTDKLYALRERLNKTLADTKRAQNRSELRAQSPPKNLVCDNRMGMPIQDWGPQGENNIRKEKLRRFLDNMPDDPFSSS